MAEEERVNNSTHEQKLRSHVILIWIGSYGGGGGGGGANQKKIFLFISKNTMGPAGFEPATSSARGWHPAKLDNGPRIARCLDTIRIICLLICEFDILGLFGSLEFEKPVTIFLLLLDYLLHHGMNNSYIHHNQYSSFPGIY
jgi:hypothetical protein